MIWNVHSELFLLVQQSCTSESYLFHVKLHFVLAFLNLNVPVVEIIVSTVSVACLCLVQMYIELAPDC